MKTPRLLCALLVSSLAIAAVTGCTKDTEDKAASGADSGNSRVASARTRCGVVSDGKLINPVQLKDGVFVKPLEVLSNNLVLVSENGDPSKTTLVKLQGVATAANAAENRNSITHITSLIGKGAYLFRATEDCNVSFSGRPGTIGHLITPLGTSVNEELIKLLYSPADRNDACEGALIGACYSALEEDQNENLVRVEACGFLWKPVSDTTGNAVVLFDECSVKLVVNGEEFTNTGAGNARCSTLRGTKTGCGYGQATLEAFDGITGLPYVFPNGETKMVLNGCQRVEFPCNR